eukprot:TRINITY_DN14429_c0_g1_i3.p1 TRINITY_DN14429_c0_g1~~TRINITY_DN14429_c0_g1_i3.p1  ORF type:complete len:1465 (+),score=142.59 TRINITY_DN14429_c0_g1_i3:83-4477(+)
MRGAAVPAAVLLSCAAAADADPSVEVRPELVQGLRSAAAELRVRGSSRSSGLSGRGHGRPAERRAAAADHPCEDNEWLLPNRPGYCANLDVLYCDRGLNGGIMNNIRPLPPRGFLNGQLCPRTCGMCSRYCQDASWWLQGHSSVECERRVRLDGCEHVILTGSGLTLGQVCPMQCGRCGNPGDTGRPTGAPSTPPAPWWARSGAPTPGPSRQPGVHEWSEHPSSAPGAAPLTPGPVAETLSPSAAPLAASMAPSSTPAVGQPGGSEGYCRDNDDWLTAAPGICSTLATYSPLRLLVACAREMLHGWPRGFTYAGICPATCRMCATACQDFATVLWAAEGVCRNLSTHFPCAVDLGDVLGGLAGITLQRLCPRSCNACGTPPPPTVAPTGAPSPRSASPTMHPCVSGYHRCDVGPGGVCIQVGADWRCECAQGWICTVGCGPWHVQHTCVPTCTTVSCPPGSTQLRGTMCTFGECTVAQCCATGAPTAPETLPPELLHITVHPGHPWAAVPGGPTWGPSTTPAVPSGHPAVGPTVTPSAAPSVGPRLQPTAQPTTLPSAHSLAPSPSPTRVAVLPTLAPTSAPTSTTPLPARVVLPTLAPTSAPTSTTPLPARVVLPTLSPTSAPTSNAPSGTPFAALATVAPVAASPPTVAPASQVPTAVPASVAPTAVPTLSVPTTVPFSTSPTVVPTTLTPTVVPSYVVPTVIPIWLAPSAVPTNVSPTATPSSFVSTVVPSSVAPSSAPVTAAPLTLFPNSRIPVSDAPPTVVPAAVAPTGVPVSPSRAPSTALPFAPSQGPSTGGSTAAPLPVVSASPSPPGTTSPPSRAPSAPQPPSSAPARSTAPTGTPTQAQPPTRPPVGDPTPRVVVMLVFRGLGLGAATEFAQRELASHGQQGPVEAEVASELYHAGDASHVTAVRAERFVGDAWVFFAGEALRRAAPQSAPPPAEGDLRLTLNVRPALGVPTHGRLWQLQLSVNHVLGGVGSLSALARIKNAAQRTAAPSFRSEWGAAKLYAEPAQAVYPPEAPTNTPSATPTGGPAGRLPPLERPTRSPATEYPTSISGWGSQHWDEHSPADGDTTRAAASSSPSSRRLIAAASFVASVCFCGLLGLVVFRRRMAALARLESNRGMTAGASIGDIYAHRGSSSLGPPPTELLAHGVPAAQSAAAAPYGVPVTGGASPPPRCSPDLQTLPTEAPLNQHSSDKYAWVDEDATEDNDAPVLPGGPGPAFPKVQPQQAVAGVPLATSDDNAGSPQRSPVVNQPSGCSDRVRPKAVRPPPGAPALRQPPQQSPDFKPDKRAAAVPPPPATSTSPSSGGEAASSPLTVPEVTRHADPAAAVSRPPQPPPPPPDSPPPAVTTGGWAVEWAAPVASPQGQPVETATWAAEWPAANLEGDDWPAGDRSESRSSSRKPSPQQQPRGPDAASAAPAAAALQLAPPVNTAWNAAAQPQTAGMKRSDSDDSGWLDI